MQSAHTSKKLFDLPLLLLIGIVLLLLLLALFPWTTAQYMGQQMPHILREQFSSPLKTQYYQLLISRTQDNKKILNTAYALREKGLWQASAVLLTKKINFARLSIKQQRQYDLILLANLIDVYRQASGLTRDKRQLLFNIRTQLQKLASDQNFSNAELQTIAEASADFGLLPLSIKFYYQLAEKSPSFRAQWLAEAGKWANRSEDYAEATKAFKLANEALNKKEFFNLYIEKWLLAAIKSQQFESIKPFFSTIKNNLPQPPAIIKKLADISIQAGLYETTTELFEYLANNGEVEQKQRWYEKVSYWAAKAENYDKAAKYLIQAKQITNNDKDRWAIQQRLIDIYIKGKKPKQALTVILPILKENPENQKLVDQAIQIALENRKILIARELNQPYLRRIPHSLNALNNQIDIEILDEEYETAVLYIKEVIKLSPNAIKPRQQWANLEEYLGNYQLALELWQWIYKASQAPKDLQKVIQLAQQGNLKQKGIHTLQQIALQQELPRQAVYDVFFHLLNSGKKELAEQFLKNYLNQYTPDRKLLKTLAKWYQGEKRYKEALQQWDKIEKNLGYSKTTSLNRFELFWLLNRKQKAFKLWKKNRSQWSQIANPAQLSVMAEIAWQYKYRKIALSYYKQLINKRYKSSKKERAFQYARIALLYEKLRQPKKALATYYQGFSKTLNTDLLITGLQLSFDRKDHYYFKRLSVLAKKYKRKFRTKYRYWLLQAAYNQQHEKYNKALKYYRKALKLKPKSKEARSGIKSIRQYLKTL